MFYIFVIINALQQSFTKWGRRILDALRTRSKIFD